MLSKLRLRNPLLWVITKFLENLPDSFVRNTIGRAKPSQALSTGVTLSNFKPLILRYSRERYRFTATRMDLMLGEIL